MSVDPALQAALGQSVVTMICPVRIDLTSNKRNGWPWLQMSCW